jgi:hypothetical protein
MDLPVGIERSDHQGVLPVHLLVALAAFAGCSSSDPVYVAAVPPSMMAGGDVDPPPALVMTVPMRLPTEEDEAERMRVATATQLPIEVIPSVRRDLTDLEIAWRLENPGDQPATARLLVAAANELFRFDPAVLVEDPDEEEPPPLMGGRPIEVAAGAVVSGVFREDELAEAAQDLDAMSRGGVNPQRALITRWETRDISGGTGGVLEAIPSAAVPLLLEVSLTVEASRPLLVSATLRIRDRSERLDPDPVNPGALVPPSTTVYAPPVMEEN